jgi:DNA-binding response OmpR family regulator
MAIIPRILVIDQEAVWRDFAKSTLYEAGYITETCSTYTLNTVIQPDLVVLGCGQFRMQEIMFIQMARSVGYPVLVMSLDGSQGNGMRSAFKSGALDVTEKPFGRLTLLGEIASCLQRLRKEPLTLVNQNWSTIG